MSKAAKDEKKQPFLQAIGVQVVVEVLEETEMKTEGGLLLPGTAMKFRFVGKGKVVSVGEGRIVMDGRLVPLRVKTGDIVLYPKVQSSEIEYMGKKFLVLPEPNIWGILDPTVDYVKV